jgi:hypothetical protein
MAGDSSIEWLRNPAKLRNARIDAKWLGAISPESHWTMVVAVFPWHRLAQRCDIDTAAI